MCGGCSNKKVDFTGERINYKANKSKELVIAFAGCTGVEIRNIGTATLRIDNIIEVEPDSSRNFCPPNGGTFAKNKSISFDKGSDTTQIIEIVYYKELPEDDCPPLNV